MRHIKIVNEEIAQKLKEVGFNEDCANHYVRFDTRIYNQLPKNKSRLKKQIKDSVGVSYDLRSNDDLENNESLKFYDRFDRDSYTITERTHAAAPTIEHAINWLRIVHNIHLVAIPDSDGIWYSYVYDVQTGLRRHGASAKEYYVALETELKNILETL